MDIRGPTWNTMSETLLEILRSGGGGVRNFWRGVREKGGSDEPPEPPWFPLHRQNISFTIHPDDPVITFWPGH